MSETADTPPRITSTIEQELQAIKTVLEALVRLPGQEAQQRVLRHAYAYLGIRGY